MYINETINKQYNNTKHRKYKYTYTQPQCKLKQPQYKIYPNGIVTK